MLKKKKGTNIKRILIITALIFALLIGGTAALAFYFSDGSSLPSTGGTLNERVSFLLIGTDRRPGDQSFNTDSIIIASFDPQTKIASLLSIPRDTRITLDNKDYKINAVATRKGIPELKKQVTALTGIELNGYVLTNFSGFKDIIDTLGGITIDVEKDMKYETGDKEDGYIDLKKGVQELDGSKALQYARFRNDATADIGRTARQQKVLMAVAKKMLEPATLLKLPKLVPQFMKAVDTELSLQDLLTLAGAAKTFDDITIVSQTLPGDAIMLDGLSYWEVNRDKAKEVAANLLQGKTTEDVWDRSVLDSMDPDLKNRLNTSTKEIAINMPEIPGIAIPKAGEKPVKTIQTEQYTATIAWSPDDHTFFPDQVYTATITLTPKAGYTLKGIKENFFVVPGATASNPAGSGVIKAVFPAVPAQADPETNPEPTEPGTEPQNPGTNPGTELETNPGNEPGTDPLAPAKITLQQINGVTAPAAGASPVTVIAETEQYTGTVRWFPIDNPFVEERQYTAKITLTPKPGFTLEGIPENYFIVPGAQTTHGAGSGVITAVFPATKKK